VNNKLRINLESETSGKVASTFIASSLSILTIGILAYFRKQLPWLEVYPPAGTFSGIWLYSYVIWAIVWLVLFIALRRREKTGTIKVWLTLFLASLATTTILVEASLNWSSIFE
jgi:hypothetical protein